MSMETYDNVFEALMDTPEEAANMTLRSDLMRAIRKEVQNWADSQTASARRLGVSQPRLNDLLRNRINKPRRAGDAGVARRADGEAGRGGADGGVSAG
jgi:predicted XRE-type DNA-binding protein